MWERKGEEEDEEEAMGDRTAHHIARSSTAANGERVSGHRGFSQTQRTSWHGCRLCRRVQGPCAHSITSYEGRQRPAGAGARQLAWICILASTCQMRGLPAHRDRHHHHAPSPTAAGQPVIHDHGTPPPETTHLQLSLPASPALKYRSQL